MGIDIYHKGRLLQQEYRLATPEGVEAFLNDWYSICSEAARGNYEAVDMLVDIAVALEDAFLSEREIDIVRLRYFDDYDIDEVAGILDVEAITVEVHVKTACTKIARYFEGTEGYE